MNTCRTWQYFIGIFLVSSQLWLLVTSQHCISSLGLEYFEKRKCHCTTSHITCSSESVDIFPIVDMLLESVTIITIDDGRFTTLNSSHLQQFPNLVELYIINSRLETITDDAFEQVPSLIRLDLSNNRINAFPKIAGLTKLERIYLQGNRIQSIEYDHVRHCVRLLTIILDYNNIEVLKSGTFSDSCILSTLNISRNDDLHTIEEDFFDGLYIRNLDVSYTKISRLPLKGLSRLEHLNVEGCTRMKHFPLANEVFNEELCANKTFPVLKSVRFEYHAHCCSYSTFKPLVSNTGKDRILPDQCTANTRNQHRDAPPPPSLMSSSISSASITSVSLVTSTATVCWKGTTLINEGVTPTLTSGATESSLQATSNIDKCCTTTELVITPTYTEIEVCSTSVATISFETTGTVTTTMLTSTSSPTPTMSSSPLPDDCSYYEYDPTLHQACIHCTSQDLCQVEPFCEMYTSVCQASTRRRKRSINDCSQSQDLCYKNRQKRMISTADQLSSSITSSTYVSKSCFTSTVNVIPTILSFSLICNSATSAVSASTTSSVISSSSYIATSSPNPTMSSAPLPDDCSYYEYDQTLHQTCIHCTSLDLCQVEPFCEMYTSVCEAGTGRRKRSINDRIETNCASSECKNLCHENRQKRDVAVHPNCSSCSVSVISTFVHVSSIVPTASTVTRMKPITTTQQHSPSNSLGAVVASSQPTVTCSPLPVLGSHRLNEHENITTACYPGNDPFNPCFHIMDDDILRVAIWLVLFIAIIGNGGVITLTLLHWAIRYRSLIKEPNLLYILYLNLAFADLFMGVYLLTIASIDIETRGHYSAEAVEWQTSAGCNFAGFCAIFSSVLSIYSLLFITIERVYSIKFALEMKRFKKKWVFMFMVFGWILAVFLAVLPIFNVNTYGRVSICLPFETRRTIDVAYISFVLVITGIASFVILLSYIYLFYLVGCSAAKKKLTHSISGKEELKLAFRMSLLIITDFATWAPIALFGLTAAFGHPLINDIKAAKVLMVFVFPLNSCLNPILYSFSTRLFRNNILNMFRKCGMCKLCDQINKSLETNSTRRHSSTYQSSDSPNMNGAKYHGRRRSTQVSILSRLTSVSSLGSNGAGSRRGSTLSGSSLEDGLPTTPNITASVMNNDRLTVPNTNGGTHLKSSWNSTGSLSNVSSSRLKSLPEETEEVQDTNYIIPIRKDSTDSTCSTSMRKVAINNELSSLSKDVMIATSKRRQSLPTILDSNHEDVLELPIKPIRKKESKAIFINHKSAVAENAETQQMEVTFF